MKIVGGIKCIIMIIKLLNKMEWKEMLNIWGKGVGYCDFCRL